jgi:hypothetical protein
MNKYAIIDKSTNDVVNIIIYDGISELQLGDNYEIVLAKDEHYSKYNEYIAIKYPVIISTNTYNDIY